MNKKQQIKRKIHLYTMLFLLGIMSILLLRINYNAYTRSTLNIGDRLPEIIFENNKQIFRIKYDSLKPSVLFIYKNKCAFCEMTLKDFNKNIENANDAIFYFLSHNVESDLIENQYNKISENLNSKFGKITSDILRDSLHVNAFPTFYIVNQNGIIKDKIKGAVKFSIIDSAINKCGVQGQNKNVNVPFTAGNNKLN